MGFNKCPNCSKEISDQAPSCPSCGHPIKEGGTEPEFRAWRIKRMKGLLILCGLAIPVGLVLKQPAVWILGILGVVVAKIKLRHLKSRAINRNTLH